jgi:hypothetical protein
MTLFDVEELTSYWTAHPPVHLSVAAYLGIGAKAASSPTAVSSPQATAPSQVKSNDLPTVQMLGAPGFAMGDVYAGLAEEQILDWNELKRRENERYGRVTPPMISHGE